MMPQLGATPNRYQFEEIIGKTALKTNEDITGYRIDGLWENYTITNERSWLDALFSYSPISGMN